MHHRGPATAARDPTGADQEGSLKHVTFVGSFPRADFRLPSAHPEICFLGRSNVGKSSLINALVGRKAIARTSKTPGKTRDCNVFEVDESLYLVDLPGYGYAQVSKTERRRFDRLLRDVLATRRRLVGVVWLLDIRRDPSEQDHAIRMRLVDHGTPVLVVLTKADKLSRGGRDQRVAAIADALETPEDQMLVTSAVKRTGIDDLRDSILALADERRA